MIRRHPPRKMLSLLIILLAMLGYFSFDLYSREQSKVKHGMPEIENLGSSPNPNLQNPPGDLQVPPNTEVEGDRPEDKVIRPGAKLIMEKRFTGCGHVSRKQTYVPNDMINLTEQQIKTAYKNWSIKSFSPEEITLYQEVNTKCPNHFILKEKDGLVAVYYQTPVNGINLKEVTPILVENLRMQDKERLKAGIKIESQQDLAQVLEDLGS